MEQLSSEDVNHHLAVTLRIAIQTFPVNLHQDDAPHNHRWLQKLQQIIRYCMDKFLTFPKYAPPPPQFCYEAHTNTFL